MNNQELELKLKELINITNYCDYVVAVKEFEPQYKKTDFYRVSKMPLKKALSEARIHYLFTLDNVINKIQKLIDNLNFENIQDLIGQFTAMYAQENSDIQETVQLLKDIMNGDNGTKN